jgi:hypothetical protein
MLGSALCNSSNAAKDPATNLTYSPYWCHLDRWAIGAQYFFAEWASSNHSSAAGFVGHAATGDLIYVDVHHIAKSKAAILGLTSSAV